MTKRFYSVAGVLLASLIALLGFGSCKSRKQVIVDPPAPPPPMTKADSINLGLLPPPQTTVKPAEPLKLVYGPPPVRKVRE